MKRFAALLSILVCIASVASPQGRRGPKHARPAKPKGSVRQNKTPDTFKSVTGLGLHFVTPDRAGGVWITGTAWLLRGLMVNDHGESINALTVPGVSSVSHPIFVTRDIGWMTDTRSLYRTEDGGFTWQEVKIPGRPDIFSIYFIDTLNGWAGGFDGEIYHTADGGQTWEKQQTGVDYEIQQIVFVDAKHGWAIGFKCPPDLKRVQALLRTDDAGNTWEILSHETPESPRSANSIVFVNVTEGWALDAWNNIVHTVDGGKTWIVQRPSEGHSWESLFFINEYEGWASGDAILHTSDGGKTWEYQLNLKRGEGYLDAITFTDVKHGWAVGSDNILRTTDGGVTWTRMGDDWKEMIPSFETILKVNALKTASK